MFYKLTENVVTSRKPETSFLWLDSYKEDMDGWIQMNVSKMWQFGFKTIELGNKDDPDFINYLKDDLVKVGKEIQEKQVLRRRLILALQ